MLFIFLNSLKAVFCFDNVFIGEHITEHKPVEFVIIDN